MTIDFIKPSEHGHLLAISGSSSHPDIHDAVYRQAEKLGTDRIFLSGLRSLRPPQKRARILDRDTSGHQVQKDQESLKRLSKKSRQLAVLAKNTHDLPTHQSVLAETSLSYDQSLQISMRHQTEEPLLVLAGETQEACRVILSTLMQNSAYPEIRYNAQNAYTHAVSALEKTGNRYVQVSEADNTKFEKLSQRLNNLEKLYTTRNDIETQNSIISKIVKNHSKLEKLVTRNEDNDHFTDLVLDVQNDYVRLLSKLVSSHHSAISEKAAITYDTLISEPLSDDELI